MAQILKCSNDFILANISLCYLKTEYASSMEALFPSSFACLDCRSCRRCRYFIAVCFILMQCCCCLLCVVVKTSATVLQTGCGRSDFGDAQAAMHSFPPQRPAVMCKPGCVCACVGGVVGLFRGWLM